MNLFVWEFKKIFKQRSSLVALPLAGRIYTRHQVR